MAELLTLLRQRALENWLVGIDLPELMAQLEGLLQQCRPHTGTAARILLRESDPAAFVAGLAVTQAMEWSVFLGNPDWGVQEWQQVEELVQPHWILSQGTLTARQLPSVAVCGEPTIQIPTGGSSGSIRFATHTWQTLIASVLGFRQYFDLATVNSFCTLPLYHVSGLMQLLRSLSSGGRLVVMPFKAVEAGEGMAIAPDEFVISLVPTQLQRLLSQSALATWLARFRMVLLGGGPAWDSLLVQARQYQIPLALTYGSTETASQVVTLKPVDFLAGNSSCGQVLPHAQVSIRDVAGSEVPTGTVGSVTIQAKSLALGYYPERWPGGAPLQLDDLGYFDDRHYLYLLGRSSQKIITGGENVFPAEIEAAIQATGMVLDVGVVGLPDPIWGEAIAALYVPKDPSISVAQLKICLQDQLSRYKLPKHWLSLPVLPRNAQGKLNYAQLQQLALEQLV